MSKNKKSVSKLKFLKIGENDSQEENSGYLETEFPTLSDEYNPQDDQTNTSDVGYSSSITSYKKFLPNENFSTNGENSDKPFKLPKFLQRDVNNRSDDNQKTNLSKQEVKSLPFSGSSVNSFSSIFNREQEEITGVQRVFRKSVSFLIINLIFFLLNIFIGLNFFSFNILITVFVSLLYVAVTNVFYIIVADRSYVWIGLAGQAVLMIFANSFYGLGFDKVTLIATVLIVLLSYMAYSDLEKVQLSSRLFSISHIATEATRIILTVSTILLSIGIYNSIFFDGTSNFLKKTIFSNNLIIDEVIIGKNPNYSLNRLLVSDVFAIKDGKVLKTNRSVKDKEATLGDFLQSNYRPGTDLMTNKEEEELLKSCKSGQVCQDIIDKEKVRRVQEWKDDPKGPYKTISYDISTKLDVAKFRDVLSRYYLFKVKEFETQKDTSSLPIIGGFSNILEAFSIPRKSIIPAVVALVVYIIFTLGKFILHWLALMLTWILWNILTWMGFSQIDIETVEAEIVSI